MARKFSEAGWPLSSWLELRAPGRGSAWFFNVTVTPSSWLSLRHLGGIDPVTKGLVSRTARGLQLQHYGLCLFNWSVPMRHQSLNIVNIMAVCICAEIFKEGPSGCAYQPLRTFSIESFHQAPSALFLLEALPMGTTSGHEA